MELGGYEDKHIKLNDNYILIIFVTIKRKMWAAYRITSFLFALQIKFNHEETTNEWFRSRSTQPQTMKSSSNIPVLSQCRESSDKVWIDKMIMDLLVEAPCQLYTSNTFIVNPNSILDEPNTYHNPTKPRITETKPTKNNPNLYHRLYLCRSSKSYLPLYYYLSLLVVAHKMF